MSDSEMEQGNSAVKALAAAAATGAATYAVRKALATRNGHDAAESEHDDSEPTEDELEEEPEASADQDDEEEPEAPVEEEDDEEPEASAEEEDEEDEEDDPEEPSADESNGSGKLRQLVDPSKLANLSHLLVPLAGEAADSAGRYVAEHTSDAVQQQVVSRFIDAYEKAS